MTSKKTAARETIWELNPATKVDDFSNHCKTRASYYCSGTVVTLFSIIGIKIIMLAALFTVHINFLQMKNLYQFITSTSYLEDAGLVLPNINANNCFPDQVSNYLILFILHSEKPYLKFEYGKEV